MSTTRVRNVFPSHDRILGVSQLPNGVSFTIQSRGRTVLAVNFRSISDLMQAGAHIKSVTCDGTNTFLTLVVDTGLLGGIILDPKQEDHLTAAVSDDLSGLLQFRVFCRFKEEILELGE